MNKNISLEWLNPETLKPNPMNWRTHPERQKKVLDAVLSEVGWAGVALFNKRTGHLIDGHARREWAIENKTEMPVLVGEWEEKDEKKILATLDPIAAMAEQADEALMQLMKGIETQNGDLLEWADEIMSGFGVFDVQDVDNPSLPSDDKSPFQQMTFTLHNDQAEAVKEALARAKNVGPFDSELNENSNGNALARICEAYRG